MTRNRVLHDPDPLLMPGEVARLLGVDVRSVGRWRLAGLIEAVRLPGGSYRYRTSTVHAILDRPGDPRVAE